MNILLIIFISIFVYQIILVILYNLNIDEEKIQIFSVCFVYVLILILRNTIGNLIIFYFNKKYYFCSFFKSNKEYIRNFYVEKKLLNNLNILEECKITDNSKNYVIVKTNKTKTIPCKSTILNKKRIEKNNEMKSFLENFMK